MDRTALLTVVSDSPVEGVLLDAPRVVDLAAAAAYRPSGVVDAELSDGLPELTALPSPAGAALALRTAARDAATARALQAYLATRPSTRVRTTVEAAL